MWIRSTGLGKTQLTAGVDGIQRKGDCLMLSLKTTDPVRWHVRAVVDGRDLIQLIKFSMRPGVVWTALKAIGRGRAKPPQDF